MSSLPKRFPDRVEIADVRAEAEQLEPGEERGEQRRLAGRVLARRDMGKLSPKKVAATRLNFLRL